MKVEIFDITKSGNGYVAEYEVEGCEITQTITRSELLEYIASRDLNYVEVFVHGGDVDGTFLDPETYLDENYYEVVKAYLEGE